MLAERLSRQGVLRGKSTEERGKMPECMMSTIGALLLTCNPVVAPFWRV